MKCYFGIVKNRLVCMGEIYCENGYKIVDDSHKLVEDGFSTETAHSIALMMTAFIEGGIMLCLTQKTNDPLKITLRGLPNLLKDF